MLHDNTHRSSGCSYIFILSQLRNGFINNLTFLLWRVFMFV